MPFWNPFRRENASPKTDPKFERVVLSTFAFIAATGAPRIIDSYRDSIGLEGDRIRIRVSRDRGQFLVGFSPRDLPAEWFDEQIVLQLIRAEDTAKRLVEGRWKSLAACADAIRENIGAIEDRFNQTAWPQSRVELKTLQERRAHELFDRPN
jgi:hypothetical protein